ncbi:MAG: hypothetical protein QNJ97_03305 [Myxococcota bacterium]|nr:hypothetical protein [Myxococcota bacterium]
MWLIWHPVANLIEKGRHPHTILFALRLVTKKHEWKILPIILRAHLHPDEAVVELASERLTQGVPEYRHGSYAMPEPTEEEYQCAQLVFAESRSQLDEQYESSISTILKNLVR